VKNPFSMSSEVQQFSWYWTNKASMAVILKNCSFITFLFLFQFLSWQIHGFKTPFHPKDVLPLLPRQVSWPILNSLYSAVDIMPTFVGVASIEGNNTLEWKGACFFKNIAWLELHNKSKSQFGGGTLHIKVFPKSNFGIVFFLFGCWCCCGSIKWLDAESWFEVYEFWNDTFNT